MADAPENQIADSAAAASIAEMERRNFGTSKEDIEAYAETAGAAAGAAVCTAYGAAPVAPLCGAIGGAIAKWLAGGVVDAWNAAFGNAEEWERYYKAKAETSAFFATLDAMTETENQLGGALNEATGRLVELFNRLNPERAGRWGGPDNLDARFALGDAGLWLGYRQGPQGIGPQWRGVRGQGEPGTGPAIYAAAPFVAQLFMVKEQAIGRTKAVTEVIRLLGTWFEDLRRAEMEVAAQIVAGRATLEAVTMAQVMTPKLGNFLSVSAPSSTPISAPGEIDRLTRTIPIAEGDRSWGRATVTGGFAIAISAALYAGRSTLQRLAA